MFLWHEIASSRGVFKETVNAANPDYSVMLWRSDRNGGAKVDYGPPDVPDEDQSTCCPLLAITFNEGLSHLLQDIENKQQQLANVRVEDDFVVVDLRLGPETNIVRQTGTLWLDPKAHYVIRSGKVRTVSQTTSPEWAFENEYDMIDGLAIPKRRRMTSLEGSNPPPIGELIVKTFSLTTPPPPEAFRASYYGVPEPPTTRTPGSYRLPTWFYLAVGGILCVVAGFGILHLARRRAA